MKYYLSNIVCHILSVFRISRLSIIIHQIMSVKYYCRLSRRVASAASGTPPLSTTLGSLGTDRQTNIYTNTQTDICTTNIQTKAYLDTRAIVTSNTNKYHWSCRYMSNRTITSWVSGPSSQISHQSTFSKYFIKYLHCKCLIKVPSPANISSKNFHHKYFKDYMS